MTSKIVAVALALSMAAVPAFACSGKKMQQSSAGSTTGQPVVTTKTEGFKMPFASSN